MSSERHTEDAEAFVDDPEKLASTKRIEQIMDSRQKAEQILLEVEASNYPQVGVKDLHDLNCAVKAFVRNIEPLRHHFDRQDEWQEETIGTVSMRDLAEARKEHLFDKAGAISKSSEIKSVEPGLISVRGLEDFLLVETPIKMRVRIKEQGDIINGNTSHTVTDKLPLPRRICANAQRKASSWLSAVGFSAEAEEETEQGELYFR